METTSAAPAPITVTPNAAEQIKALANKTENSGKVLRVYVEQGGCSGMQYSMTFDEPRTDDRRAESQGVSVLVDSFSAQYLSGATVDFSDAMTGGGFKISNPNARQSCGCGKSFST